MPDSIKLPPPAEVSEPQIEAGFHHGTNLMSKAEAQDSNLKAAPKGCAPLGNLLNLLNLLTFWRLSNMSNFDEQVAKNRFTPAPASCYIGSVAPVKRERDWRPAESPRRKPWSLFAESAAFLSALPVYGGSDGGPCARRFSQEVPGTPTCPSCRLPLAWEVVVLANRTILEAIMATSFNALTSEPVSPATGAPDPIQLHADAHNALSMAVFYLRQPQVNTAAARRKAIQALTALRGLSLALEG